MKTKLTIVLAAAVVVLSGCIPLPKGTTVEQWAKLRNCESGAHGLYRANTGNGYYGAYQFNLTAWRGQGGKGLPSDAPSWEQDARAYSLYLQRGSKPWPVCGRYLP